MHFSLFGCVSNMKGDIWKLDGFSMTKLRPILRMECGDYTSCKIIDFVDGDDGSEGSMLLYPFLQDKFFDYYGCGVLDIFPVGGSFELHCAGEVIAIFKVLSHKMM